MTRLKISVYGYPPTMRILVRRTVTWIMCAGDNSPFPRCHDETRVASFGQVLALADDASASAPGF